MKIGANFPNFQEAVLKVDLDCLTLGSLELGTVAAQLLGEMFEFGIKTPPMSVRKYVMEVMASWPIGLSRIPSGIMTPGSTGGGGGGATLNARTPSSGATLNARVTSTSANTTVNEPSSSLDASGKNQMKYHSFAQCVDTLATMVKLLHRHYCGGKRYINDEE
jgi:hypothetical protein